jgi:hypothetical protein
VYAFANGVRFKGTWAHGVNESRLSIRLVDTTAQAQTSSPLQSLKSSAIDYVDKDDTEGVLDRFDGTCD